MARTIGPLLQGRCRARHDADRIKTRVTIRLEPRGEKRVERIAEIDNTVEVFGIGKVVEAFIEKQTRATYQASDEFTRRWLAGERG